MRWSAVKILIVSDFERVAVCPTADIYNIPSTLCHGIRICIQKGVTDTPVDSIGLQSGRLETAAMAATGAYRSDNPHT